MIVGITCVGSLSSGRLIPLPTMIDLHMLIQHVWDRSSHVCDALDLHMFDPDSDDDASVPFGQSRFVECLEVSRETCRDVIVVITCLGSLSSGCLIPTPMMIDFHMYIPHVWVRSSHV